MNLHVITPTDLKEDALIRYKEMLLKPRDEGHEKFLKNQIKMLQNGNIGNCIENHDSNSFSYLYMVSGTDNRSKQRREAV